MKTIAKLAVALALVAGVTAATAVAAEETVTGKVMCAKCTLKKAGQEQCQDVLVATDAAGKTTEYYVEKNDVAKAFGHTCKGDKPAAVTESGLGEGRQEVDRGLQDGSAEVIHSGGEGGEQAPLELVRRLVGPFQLSAVRCPFPLFRLSVQRSVRKGPSPERLVAIKAGLEQQPAATCFLSARAKAFTSPHGTRPVPGMPLGYAAALPGHDGDAERQRFQPGQPERLLPARRHEEDPRAPIERGEPGRALPSRGIARPGSAISARSAPLPATRHEREVHARTPPRDHRVAQALPSTSRPTNKTHGGPSGPAPRSRPSTERRDDADVRGRDAGGSELLLTCSARGPRRAGGGRTRGALRSGNRRRRSRPSSVTQRGHKRRARAVRGRPTPWSSTCRASGRSTGGPGR